jgi:methionyl aminopeptidase
VTLVAGGMVTLKSDREIDAMRVAGAIVSNVLRALEAEVRAGVQTSDLDRIAEEMIRGAGAIPSFKGYRPSMALPPYPASICVSIGEEVVHGVPGGRRIRDGDVVSIDAGAIWEGYHGDAARTFIVGQVPARVRSLVEAARTALDAGIAAAQPGGRLGDISAAIEDIGKAGGYGIVQQYVGHGIGQEMHEPPQVPNYRGRGEPYTRKLVPGLCLAIEPMFTLGAPETVVRGDRWTVATRDRSVAAHFEDTIAITSNGPEVLTRR